jgi:chitodextrinase
VSRTIGSSVAAALLICAVFTACQNGAESPSDRSVPVPNDQDTPGGGSSTAPLDLVYVCGNRFLATNHTAMPARVTYRVSGTEETGELTLEPGYQGDPGYSETELVTTEPGVVELYKDGDRVARRSNGRTPCGSGASFAVGGTVGAAEGGSWSAPFPWPIVGLEVAVLPNGKVLSWGATGNPHVWDPATGVFTETPEPAELFCSGLTLLSDGRVIAAGGHISVDHGLPNISIFDPVSQSWSSSVAMRRGRWYPSTTVMANGDVVIMAGRDQSGTQVGVPEVWSSGSPLLGASIRSLTGAQKNLQYYPRAFLAPNGLIFYAGEEQATAYLNPYGSGVWLPVGNRLYGRRDYGAAVMYEPGKILYVGGGRTTNTAEVIDLNSPAPAWRWTGSMAVQRRHLNATLLPTGEVLVTGGTTGTAFNSLTGAVHSAELWSPVSETWTTLASNSIDRVYHSTSVLLPDGRVLHTGSGDADGAPDQLSAELFSPPYLFQGPRPSIVSAPSTISYGGVITVETPDAADIVQVSFIRLGSTTHAFNTSQRFQWLSFTRNAASLSVTAPGDPNIAPPGDYLLFILNGSGVPSIGKIVRISGAVSGYSGPITLSITGRSDSTRQYVTLKWVGGRTSTVDMYRNGIFRKNTPNDGKQGDSKAFTGPATYTYKVCEAGSYTCSNPATMQFNGGSLPVNHAPIAAFTTSCSATSCTFHDGSVDLDGNLTAWQWTFGDGSSSNDENPSHLYAAPGSYSVTLTVTDDRGATTTVTHLITIAPGS